MLFMINSSCKFDLFAEFSLVMEPPCSRQERLQISLVVVNCDFHNSFQVVISKDCNGRDSNKLEKGKYLRSVEVIFLISVLGRSQYMDIAMSQRSKNCK